ncbi:MAG: serine/threonine-protein kinase [Gemmatimonadota bacterium]
MPGFSGSSVLTPEGSSEILTDRIAMAIDSMQWERVKETFAELSALGSGERARLLALLAVAEPQVHTEVAGLLLASDSVGDRFEHGAGGAPSVALSSLVGRRIDHWEIVREVGQGGMGAVYEAHRIDAQYTKRVAIKTVAAGRNSEGILHRFRRERQILARLEHPNIATLLDGGVTPDGQPYFVMEYVEGEPIDQWCAARRAGVRERVALVRQVCAAVQYAHEHLVIHRDLKPRNILVAADGAGTPTVKLLDFGIAKLLDPTGTDEDELTRTGALPMTAAYASPEQRRGEAVATASDVYSLGVVLYELLAGVRPFGDQAPVSDPLGQSATPPSRAVTESASVTSAEGSARRLRRALSGELDSIVLKSLRPEPDRRYRSVQLLADDLGRYLEGGAVRARSDAFGYRASRFLRRHRVAVAAGVLAVAALLGGTVISLEQARAANRERDHALREGLRTRQVTEFFQGVLASAKPQRQGRGVTVVDAIDSAIVRTDSAFTTDPDLRAAIKLTLGATLNDMYLYERARPLLEDSYRIRKSLDGDAPSKDQADALYDLANIEAQIGSPARAESLYRVSLALLGRLPAPDSADIYEGLSNVAEALLNQGKLAGAAALYDTVALALDRLKPADVELRGITRANRGTALAQLGRSRDAEPVLREAVRLFEQSRGPDDPRVASALQPLAGTLILNQKYAEAEQAARRAMTIDEREFGPTNPATLSALRMLTSAMIESGRCTEALPRIRSMVALRGHELSEADPTLGVALLQLGQCEAATGDLDGGARTLRDALAVRRKALGPDHWAVAQTESVLGEVLGHRRENAEAETLLRAGYLGLKTQLAPGDIRTEQARVRLERFMKGR